MQKKYVLALVVFISGVINAQQSDELFTTGDSTFLQEKPDSSMYVKANERSKRWRAIILPAGLITYGFISLNSDPLKDFDMNLKNEIREDHPHFHTPIDNYLQYAPAIMVYGLDALGIKGKNNIGDQTMIYLLSNAMMGITVQSLKRITRIQRPDGFGHNAFPSGHTATAFVSAEFLRQEYKDVSPWYGAGGYMAASATAILRMYNNKHWFRDLLPGAGIGILSTRIAYWVYPVIKKKLFRNKPMQAMAMPYYENKTFGLSFIYHLRH